MIGLDIGPIDIFSCMGLLISLTLWTYPIVLLEILSFIEGQAVVDTA